MQIRTPQQLDLFELKSFTGRMTSRSPNRLHQIEDSLRTAAKLRPDSWSLVVPIDHNPQELTWFDGLRREYPFPLTWYGRTWLDGQMATFPDIHRYYIEDARDEVLALLRELNAEQATLGRGAVDAIARLDHLRTRLNELDPQFRFDLTPGPAKVAMRAFPHAAMYSQRQGEHGPVTIAVIPKYRDALRDRPIMVRVGLQFPDSEIGYEAAARFRAFLDYGDPAIVDEANVHGIEVEAPGGLGGALGPGTLRVGPVPDADFQLDARLRVFNEAGSQLASLPVRFTNGYGGMRGRTIAGQDTTGVLHISVRFEETTRQVRVNVEVKPVGGLLPAALLAPLRLAHALRTPNAATVTIAMDDLWPPIPLPDLELVPTEYLELVEQLARVQAETNTTFPLPAEVDADDVATLHRITRLLDGDPLALRPDSINLTLKPGALSRSRQPDIERGRVLAVQAESSQTLMGEVIPLGICNIVIGPARFEEKTSSDPTLPPGHTRARLVPLPGARAFLRRGPLVPTLDVDGTEEDDEDG